jgi:hypothetical protein
VSGNYCSCPPTYGRLVYEQIEQMSRQGKIRSSKSFSNNEKGPPRTSSPQLDSASSSRSRLSTETNPNPSSLGTGPNAPVSRPSFEKSRALKMFKSNTRSSIDRDTESNQSGHKKSASLSESLKQPTTPSSEQGSTDFAVNLYSFACTGPDV